MTRKKCGSTEVFVNNKYILAINANPRVENKVKLWQIFYRRNSCLLRWIIGQEC